MSASRERKKRMTAEQPAAQPATAKKKKLPEALIFVVSIVLVLAIVFGSIAIYRAHWRNATVVTVGEHEVSTVEFNYFLNNVVSDLVNSYGSYLSIIGLDPSVRLTEQNVPNTDENVEPQTWAAYLADSAKTMAVNYYTVCDEAAKNGYELTQEQLDTIESQITTVSAYAKLYSVSADTYIENMFGKGCDVDSYRDFLKLSYIYSDYISSLEYTDQEIADRYAKDPAEFDYVAYQLYTSAASSFAGKNDDGTTAEITDENRASAKAAAEEMMEKFEGENVVDYTEQSKSSITSTVCEEAAEWLFSDSVKADDLKMFESGDNYYVVKFVSRTDNDYKTVDYLQIYIKNDSTDDSSDSSSTDETKQTSAEKVAALKEALEKDSTEENFKKLVSTYSDSSTSAYTQATHKSIANQEVYEWLFNGNPSEGDYKVFETSAGTYAVLFQGYDKTCKDILVSNMLTNEWFEALTKDVAYDYNADNAMHSHLDYALNSVYNLNRNSSIS